MREKDRELRRRRHRRLKRLTKRNQESKPDRPLASKRTTRKPPDAGPESAPAPEAAQGGEKAKPAAKKPAAKKPASAKKAAPKKPEPGEGGATGENGGEGEP